MREINASIPFDKALWREDIAASKAHAEMLAAQGIVSEVDAAEIAKGLDMAIVVEGIETNGQALIVTEAGCEKAQGYLYGKPADAKETVELILAACDPDLKARASA